MKFEIEKRHRCSFGLVFASLLLVLSYQACGPNLDFSSTRASVQGGNGDSYTGKTGYFAYFDSAEPCAQIGKDGRPFPNEQIFISDTSVTLARTACSNITPQELSREVISTDQDGGLIYAGKRFETTDDLNEFNLVARACPAGRTPLAQPQVTNLIADPLNWTTDNWVRHAGLSVSLNGAIESLPRFRIERTDPARLENWRRISQMHYLTNQVDYAYSVLLQSGNVDEAWVNMYLNDTTQFGVAFNLSDGSSFVDYNMGVSNLSMVAQPYGPGVVVTVFFTAPQGTTMHDIGISSYSSGTIRHGDYIYATAADLAAVDSYCAR